jgi:hypothetical protein
MSVKGVTSMTKLFATTAILVALATPAAAQRYDLRPDPQVDFSPQKPQAINPKMKIKMNILDFRIGMTRSESDELLKKLGCQKQTKEYAGVLDAIGCSLPQGKIKLTFVKGFVQDAETDVVKSVDLFFDSNDGASQVLKDVANQFNAKPMQLSEAQNNMLRTCTPGTRRYSCGQGELASWILDEDLFLTLILNQAADDERGKSDNYWLKLNFLDELPAEKMRKEVLSQKRSPATTPKF